MSVKSGTWLDKQDAYGAYRAFLPENLNNIAAAINLGPLAQRIEAANLALGRLDGLALQITDISLYLYFYARKEAVLSTQIEGTRSTLSDVLLFEQTGIANQPDDDIRTITNYDRALEYGVATLQDRQAISLQLLRELHLLLLKNTRGADKQPGIFRLDQNWIGGQMHTPVGSDFVPPPPEHLSQCLEAWERFVQAEDQLPILIKAGLAHAQFETIHPFHDGNGRLGRLVIVLILLFYKRLSAPLLFMSLYFKTNRQRYYDFLQKTRTESAWQEWLDFFLRGVEEAALQGIKTAQQLIQLHKEDSQRIHSLHRSNATVIRVFHLLEKQPYITARQIIDKLVISAPAAQQAISKLAQLGILEEITGRARDRVYVYKSYLEILDSVVMR